MNNANSLQPAFACAAVAALCVCSLLHVHHPLPFTLLMFQGATGTYGTVSQFELLEESGRPGGRSQEAPATTVSRSTHALIK